MRLYTKENKSLKEIAEIFSCSSTTILKRFREYGIPFKGRRFQELTKPLLRKLYIKEGKTTREIADMVSCSANLIRLKCKAFGIPLRNPGTKKVHIDKSTLRKLYVKEGKCMYEIAEILGCSASLISVRVRRLGLKKEKGDNQKGGDQNRYRPFITSNEV